MADIIPVLTESEVLEYLGIDYADEMVSKNINRIINTTNSYLKGAIGKNYPVEDPRAKELALIVAADLYDNRTLTEPTANTRRLVNDFSMQLRLELESDTDV